MKILVVHSFDKPKVTVVNKDHIKLKKQKVDKSTIRTS